MENKDKISIDLPSLFSLMIKKNMISINKMDDTDNIICFSDYAGDNSEIDIYAYLFVDAEKWNNVIEALEKFRDSENDWDDIYYLQYKEPQEKKFSALREKILTEFLCIINQLYGNLFIVSIDSSVTTLIHEKGYEYVNKELKELGYGKWKNHISKRQHDIIVFQSLFASKILNKNHNYTWISDRDATNDEGKGRVHKMIDLWSQLFKYFDVEYKKASFGTNNIECDFSSTLIGDLLSVTDLVIGASLELLQEKYGKNLLKKTSSETLNWFRESVPTLSKNHIHLSNVNGNMKLNVLKLNDAIKNNKSSKA